MIFLFYWVRFLGHFQPQQGKPALWELGLDPHYDAGRLGDDDARYLNVTYGEYNTFCSLTLYELVFD